MIVAAAWKRNLISVLQDRRDESAKLSQLQDGFFDETRKALEASHIACLNWSDILQLLAQFLCRQCLTLRILDGSN